MNEKEHWEVVQITKDYYDSDDAHNFYFMIWGGEDLHLGIYYSEDEPIFDASRRTVDTMAARSENLGKESRVLDIGAGFGGTARHLARTFGCHVTCLNLSETENRRNRKMTKEQGLDHLIEVVDGNFENLPYPDNYFDIVWSQDAILHSGEREKVMQEMARVVRKGGEIIFTDPMQADNCPDGVLDQILERIHLESLASPSFYRETAKKLDLEEVGFEDYSQHLTRHYTRVLEETKRNEEMLSEHVSMDYIERMKKGLQHWIEGGKKGYLAWGIFHFRKR